MRRRLVLFSCWLLVVVVAIFTPLDVLDHPVAKFLLDHDGFSHAVLFFGLAVTGGLLLPAPSRKALARLLVGGIAFAALTEVAQELLPIERAGRLSDFGFDVLGLLLGLAAVRIGRGRAARLRAR